MCIRDSAEAEAYPGPSLIIGYAPCELHGVKGGMTNCQNEMKKAVEAGYWNLFTFNPACLLYTSGETLLRLILLQLLVQSEDGGRGSVLAAQTVAAAGQNDIVQASLTQGSGNIQVQGCLLYTSS